ncbi:MAG: helix-turn-helix domain-containing protein [Bacteroidales bacterium]|nr:helix-turn-helix domain-containing protein [Bacteroidales bacterium]
MICQCESCDLKMLFFNCIDHDQVEEYCESRKETTYEEGEPIIIQGDQISDFLYLKEGLVKLFRKNEHGDEQIISFGKPYDFVSILSVFSNSNYNYSVTALQKSVVCSFDLKQITELIQSNGTFALHLIQTLNKSSDRIILNSLSLLQKRLYGRVAYLLLYFSEDIFFNSDFDLPVSRKEMAQFIGMSQENVIRAMSALRKDGIIQVFGKSISIKDKLRLNRMRDLS